jgi:deoxyribodipyrimidine photo-lyase
LAAKGIPLICVRSDDVAEAVCQVAIRIQASQVYYNIEYEVNESRRDLKASQLLEKENIKVFSFHDQCIIEPGKVRTKENKVYNVFTPFKKCWIATVLKDKSVLKLFETPNQALDSVPKDALDYCSKNSTIPTSEEIGFPKSKKLKVDLRKEWPIGEAQAIQRLEKFIQDRSKTYDTDRDFPSTDGTSRLSAYLATGVISAKMCLIKAKEANQGKLDSGNAGLVTWISEIVWREFYRHILFAYPRVCMNKAFKKDTDSIPWNYDKDMFEKWCNGQTGYPIVDAGMRQLNETGWMHNRLRMIVAMFLTKHLLIDWRWGEKYFMNHLIDGDFASNNGGWQWASSTGTDSQPYFRIFNPMLQSERFDAQGKFIKKYVPELQDLSGKKLMDPYGELSPAQFAKLGYPKPMVDHKAARDKCLETFKTALSKLK